MIFKLVWLIISQYNAKNINTSRCNSVGCPPTLLIIRRLFIVIASYVAIKSKQTRIMKKNLNEVGIDCIIYKK